MNILAFNSSPRDHETSKTELVLQKFLEGASRAGAATETLYLKNYKIKHCLGCYSCWLKTPGRCVQKDDMAEELFDRYLARRPGGPGQPHLPWHHERPDEALRGAHPAHDGPPGGNGRSRGGHPHRFEKMPRVVTLSVCGFWDQSHVPGPVPDLAHVPGRGPDRRNLPAFFRIPEPCPSSRPRPRRCWTPWPRPGRKWCARARSRPETLAALTQHLAPADTLMRLSREFWSQGQ